MRVAGFRFIAALAAGMVEGRGFAQLPQTIVADKTDYYIQNSATAQQANGSYLTLAVTFATPPPTSTAVAVQGPNGSFTLDRESDGSYDTFPNYDSRALLDAGVPDGMYTVSVSGGTAPSRTTLTLIFGSTHKPFLISDYDLLQSWPDAEPIFEWTGGDQNGGTPFYRVSAYTPSAKQIYFAQVPGPYNALTTKMPVATPLVGVVGYTGLTLTTANSGATAVGMGSGVAVQFGFECVPVLPVVEGPPVSSVVQVGATATLWASATDNGFGALSYQWLKNGVEIPGANRGILTIANSQAADAGAYSFQVTNDAGTVASDPGWLAVSDSLSFVVYAGRQFVAGSMDGNPGGSTFNGPHALAIDGQGNIYVADTKNCLIRKIGPTDFTTTIAGKAGQSGSIDGLGSAARFSAPNGIAVDALGNLYVSDGAYSIRKIDPTGQVTTLAGNYGVTGAADGSGVAAQFSNPQGLATDAAGNIYVADSGNNKIRKITPDGSVTTLAGSGSVGKTDGQGAAAQFNMPSGVACDGAGNIYVADFGNHALRQITPLGLVTTVGNSGNPSATEDGLIGSAYFGTPTNLALDAVGNLFVQEADRIYEITTQGIVRSLVGGASGAGQKTYTMNGFTVDRGGTVYIADALDQLILQGTVVPGNPDPHITLGRPLRPAAIATGSSASFSIAAAGPVLTYQWLKNGAPIVGATDYNLLLTNTTAADGGSYSVKIANSVGMTTSLPAQLTVTTTVDPGRIINLSIRADAGTGAQVLTAGFYIKGVAPATKQILLRGIGPTLGKFGIVNSLPDPAITVFDTSQNPIGGNNDWGGSPALAAAFASSGAFALPADSLDSALSTNLPAGGYTVQVTGNGQNAGVALAEIYDLSLGAAGAASRLVNVSARANSGNGSDVLTAGFVVGGSTAMTVLVRGIGPSLSFFNVTGRLALPTLTVFDSWGNIVASNTGWGKDRTLASVFTIVHAFSLDPAGTDCAVVTTLPPGAYSAQVGGLGGSTGVALVEIYEVQ